MQANLTGNSGTTQKMQSMERTQSFFSPLTFRQVFFLGCLTKKHSFREKSVCKGRATEGGLNTLAQQRPSGGAFQHLRNLGPSMLAECSMIFTVMFVIQSFQSLRHRKILSPRHSHGCKGHAPDLVHETSMDMGHGISRGMVHISL